MAVAVACMLQYAVCETHCESLLALASLAARDGLRLRRWDFVSAYLQGSLEEGEVVYCPAPPGYERTNSEGYELCCKVVKPIYGMSQAGRRWQRALFPWLIDFGFVQSEQDPCIFRCDRTTDTPDGPRAPRAPKRPHAMPWASPEYLKMIIRPQYIPRGGRSRPATSARRFFP